MLELLNQLDGFDEQSEIKIILATNAIESLDPALIRPGRIDRKIEMPLPDYEVRETVQGIAVFGSFLERLRIRPENRII